MFPYEAFIATPSFYVSVVVNAVYVFFHYFELNSVGNF